MINTFAAVSGLYARVGKESAGEAMLRRVQLPGLISDYGIIEDMREDLRGSEGAHLSRPFRDFELYARRRRNDLVQLHVDGLHRDWLESGGRFLLAPDASLHAVLAAKAREQRLVDGGHPVESEFFGVIDPTHLNAPLDAAFLHGPGQVMFAAALAVAIGKNDVNLQKIPREARLRGIDTKSLGWKELPIDWRRARVILNDKTAFYAGLDGYKLFAQMYADGSMLKAYKIASALLGEGFRRLAWGKQINLSVDDVDRIKADLLKALTDKTLQGLDGYKKFAKEKFCGGSMQQAYKIASALLGEGFRRLAWGKQINLSVDDVDRIKADLLKALTDKTLQGLDGYKLFAQMYADGSMLKAYKIASALLGEDFQRLAWGNCIYLSVDDVDRVKLWLNQVLRDIAGEERFVEFLRLFRQQPLQALVNARALIGDKVDQLSWPDYADVERFNRFVDWVDIDVGTEEDEEAEEVEGSTSLPNDENEIDGNGDDEGS